MKKRILVLMIGFLLISFNLYATDGDLIVEGNVGIGTTGPRRNLDIVGNGTWMGVRLQNTGAGGRTYIITSTNNDNYAGGGLLGVWDPALDKYPLIIDGRYGVGRIGIGLGAWDAPNATLHVDAQEDVYIDRTGPTGFNNRPYIVLRDGSTQFSIAKRGGGNFGQFNVEASNIYFSGNVGIGTTTPTAKLDVNGSTGYNQLRLRTAYTPIGTSDANGNVGDITRDDNYVYVKTSAGWKRATLTTW